MSLRNRLNFFELIAYFEKQGILSIEDVRALLGYYLDLLRTKDIRAYLRENSYGELDRLLGIIEKSHVRTRGAP